ncbi:MAG: GNAT family N-acetyltransferase [Anaerolineae bacterium]|nr:GNAT family N-acetyltransferase [Anaerolineae bacterium]
MSTLSASLTQRTIGKMRPLNVMRDLLKVADLVELCFHHNMDREGQRYVHQMRAASKDRHFLSWASNSLPLRGYVWEDQKEIVGNISIIPFRKAKKNIFLLANIAVHPDYRRKGIARLLTQKGMDHVRKRGSEAMWVQVEEDNLGAIKLYEELGFQARALRTTWDAASQLQPKEALVKSNITTRVAHFWPQQYQLLKKAYAEELSWYRMPDWENFRPGIKYWLYRIFVENDVRQWAAQKDGSFQAGLIWIQTRTRRAPLWLAAAPDVDTETLAALLLHARFHLASQNRELYIDYPAGELNAAFEEAGFILRRTLLWMCADE